MTTVGARPHFRQAILDLNALEGMIDEGADKDELKRLTGRIRDHLIPISMMLTDSHSHAKLILRNIGEDEGDG